MMEQFCILAKTQKGKACVAVVQQVLSHRNIYNFGELLDVASIRQLNTMTVCDSNDAEFKKAFDSLELFAYGSYCDYKGKLCCSALIYRHGANER